MKKALLVVCGVLLFGLGFMAGYKVECLSPHERTES
jgi:hypothetical protein